MNVPMQRALGGSTMSNCRIVFSNCERTRSARSVAAPSSPLSNVHRVSTNRNRWRFASKTAAAIPPEEISKQRRFIQTWFASASSLPLGFFHSVTAELIPHDCKQPVGECLIIAGTETLHQRQSNYRHRQALLHRLGDGPAAFARVGNKWTDMLKIPVLGEC